MSREEHAKSILDASDRLLTAEAFYEVIVAKGWEDIAQGYEKPTLTQTMHAMEMLQKLEKEGQDNYRPEDLINQLDIILMAIRDIVPAAIKEELFNKIEEYQNGAINVPGKPKKLKKADIDVEYIDDDLYEEDL